METKMEEASSNSGDMVDTPATLEIDVPADEKSAANVTTVSYESTHYSRGLYLFLTLNASMFILGLLTLDDCPVRPIIPVYLVVTGTIGIASKIVIVSKQYKKFEWVKWLMYGLLGMEVLWQLLGSYWIYSIYEPNYFSVDGPYCNKATYLLGFWMLNTHYIFILIVILFLCCMYGLVLFSNDTEKK